MEIKNDAVKLQEIIAQIRADPQYQNNIEYGEPRPGHPEGKIKYHIADLESNLEQLIHRGISPEQYWKLKFLIHVHDTFKAEAERDVPPLHPRSHATLAREYASRYIADPDLLNMIQFHDQNYYLWVDHIENDSYDSEVFQHLIHTVQDWDLFLMFTIIDGRTRGKDISKLVWFIKEVNKYMPTYVDASWIGPIPF